MRLQSVFPEAASSNNVDATGFVPRGQQKSGAGCNLCRGGRRDAISGRRHAGLARTGVASAGSISTNKRLIFEVLCSLWRPSGCVGAVGKACSTAVFEVASLFGFCSEGLQNRRDRTRVSCSLRRCFASGHQSARSFQADPASAHSKPWHCHEQLLSPRCFCFVLSALQRKRQMRATPANSSNL